MDFGCLMWRFLKMNRNDWNNSGPRWDNMFHTYTSTAYKPPIKRYKPSWLQRKWNKLSWFVRKQIRRF